MSFWFLTSPIFAILLFRISVTMDFEHSGVSGRPKSRAGFLLFST